MLESLAKKKNKRKTGGRKGTKAEKVRSRRRKKKRKIFGR